MTPTSRTPVRRSLAFVAAAAVLCTVPGTVAWAADNNSNSAIRDQLINFKDIPSLIKNPTFVTLKFDNADVREVLRLVAQRGGMNLILDESVTGRFTIDVRAVPLDEFFGIVLRTNGLGARRIGTSLLIAKEAQLREKIDSQQAGTFRLNNAAAKDAEKLLKDVVIGKDNKDLKLIADERTNSILVVGTGEDLVRVRNAIRAIDIPAPQVVIEVKLVEVSRKGTRRLGAEFGFGGSKFGLSNNVTNPDSTANGQPNAGIPAGGGTSVTFSAMGNITSNLNARIDALVESREAQVLANPRIATQDSNTAELHIVNKFPVLQVNFTPGAGGGAGIAAENVTFRDIGQNLKITPRIDTGGYVTMDIEPEISTRGNDIIVNRNPVPEINSRSLKTKMRVADGETVVIAGLISRDESSTARKMPFLGDLPLIGFLFRSDSYGNNENEIIIMVTPHITTGERPTD